MKREIIYTGFNKGVIDLLINEGIRTTRISNISNFLVSNRAIYIHYETNCSALELEEENIHHLEWAKSKGLQSFCICNSVSLGKTKYLYKLGFDKVFKASTTMSCLLKAIKTNHIQVPEDILGSSQVYNIAVTKLYNALSRQQDAIFITGETGVGKTHLVKKITKAINPKSRFISKNLSEYSPQILESELFGHVKGAFTGALSDRKGLFEQANGGVLFLDEIATIPMSTQQKILKIIEEKKVTPVGSNKSIDLDFQLITATCEDLSKAVKNGTFREDLYFRLAITSIQIPSVSQRALDGELEDILYRFQENQDHQVFFTNEAIDQLKEYKWKGNFRDVQSLFALIDLEEISILTKGNIPTKFHQEDKEQIETLLTDTQKEIIKTLGLPELIKEIEMESFKSSFTSLGGRTNKICEELKISKSVYYRISQAI